MPQVSIRLLVLVLPIFCTLLPAQTPVASSNQPVTAKVNPAAAAVKLPDTIQAKVVSVSPDQKAVQGIGPFSRILVISIPIDSSSSAAARLDTLSLSCRRDGATSVIVSGVIPSTHKNGKSLLTLSGLQSNGRPVVVSGMPFILVDTDPPKVDVAQVRINGRSARLFKGDTLIVDAASAVNRNDAVLISIAIDSGAPVAATLGKSVFFKVSEGAHRIRIVAQDRAGNKSQAAELPVTVDRTPPDVSKARIMLGSGKSVVAVSKVFVKISGITDATGVKSVWYRTGTAAASVYSGDSVAVTLNRDGADSVIAWAEDSIGNRSTQLRAKITRDARVPTASVTHSRLWGTGKHQIVWVFDELMDTAVAAVAMFDSSAIAVRWVSRDTLKGTVAVDSATANGNRKIILVSAADPAGNVCGRVTGEVTVDTRAPEFSVKNVMVNKGNLSVSCDSAMVSIEDVRDPSGVAKYWFVIDGDIISDTASPRVMLRKLADGRHHLKVTIADGAENTAPPVTMSFDVDASRPRIKGAVAGMCDTVAMRIPVTLTFTKAMDDGALPSLKTEGGAFADARWTDSVTLACMYNPESKGAVDTLHIIVKGGRDRGGESLEAAEAVCVVGPDTVLHLAKQLSTKGNHVDAAGLLGRLSASQPYRTDIAEMWAAESREIKDRTGERQAMERLAKLRPADKNLLRSLTNLSSQMGDRKASKEWLRQLMVAEGKLDAVSSADYRREGRSFFSMTPGACIASTKGDEAAALVAEGIMAVTGNDLRAAREAFVQALALDSTCLEAIYNLATLQLLDNKPLDAESALARCTDADERFAGNYAVALAMSGKLDIALKLFTEKKISTEDPAIAGVYGVLLIRSGKTSEALPFLEKASTAGTVQRVNYAFGLYTAKEYQKSLAVFKTCGSLSADTFPEIYYGRALAEIQLGDADAAVADLQAAVAIQPVYLDAQMKLGDLLIRRKDRAGAKHALSFAARADSTSSAAHQALAALYQETGESDLARAEAMNAARPPRKDSTAMTVAVEQFKNVTQDSTVGWLSVGMAEALSTEMTRFSPYRMLERVQIEAITKRMALKQATGAETEAEESQLRKALGAKAIVTGSFQAVGANLRIDGRLIDVQTGKILTTGSTSGTMDELSRMQRTLALALAGRADALELAELSGGVSADAQRRMALAKTALYSGDAKEAKKLADEALMIDPLALSLAGSMAVAMANEGRGKSMAVLPFDNLTAAASDAGMGSAIQEALITNLRKAGNLSIVERSQIDKLSAEIGLGQSGLVEESSASTVGNMLAAGVLLTGGYQVSGNKIRITAKLLDVVTAEVLLATDVSGKKDALFDLEDQLAARILAILKDAPVVDSVKQLDPTQRHGADTAVTALSDEPQSGDDDQEESVDSDDGRDKTLARRLTFFVAPLGFYLRGEMSTLTGDAGFHFINEIFAVDGLFDISLNDLLPKTFEKNEVVKIVDPASVKTVYRSIEAGAGWNFGQGWNSDDTKVTFGQLRGGYKSLEMAEVAQRVDTLPPYLGGRTYVDDEANVTLNTTQRMAYAGLALVRKKAEGSRRKTFRLYGDCLYAPYIAYTATENDGSPYTGYTNALVLQHLGARLGMELTQNYRFGLRWLFETGVRPGVHNANLPFIYNLYISAKIGVCSSWM